LLADQASLFESVLFECPELAESSLSRMFQVMDYHVEENLVAFQLVLKLFDSCFKVKFDIAPVIMMAT
jgi:hypothetical protein